MVVYVREVKGPDSLVLLWHVCLAKDKFFSENLPEQLSSTLQPPSCVLWVPLLHAAVSSGLQSGAAWKKEMVFEQEVGIN